MHIYPFTAIVGQEEMKLALVLSVIEPQIGGVLILGHRGTGKSTAVRALADLLPPIQRVRGCPFGSAPMVRAGYRSSPAPSASLSCRWGRPRIASAARWTSSAR
jgi:Mg-chelatase subunit ChlI